MSGWSATLQSNVSYNTIILVQKRRLAQKVEQKVAPVPTQVGQRITMCVCARSKVGATMVLALRGFKVHIIRAYYVGMRLLLILSNHTFDGEGPEGADTQVAHNITLRTLQASFHFFS